MLTQIDDHVFAAESVLDLVAGFRIPVRMTVIRNPEGDLWVHSPLAIDDALAAEIDALGTVRWLVAPNCLHHLFFEAASQRWPNAEKIASPGLAKKRKDLTFDAELPTQGSFKAWDGWIDSCFIDGAPGAGETVFLHNASGSLIVTDLLFNLPKEAHNKTSWVLLSLAGVRGRFARCRSWYMFTKDRKAMQASMKQILAWEFERVIPGHGDVLATNAKAAVQNALGKHA